MKFHISDDGQPRPCKAKEGGCRLASDHYDTQNEARSAYESKMQEKNIPKTSKKSLAQQFSEVFSSEDTKIVNNHLRDVKNDKWWKTADPRTVDAKLQVCLGTKGSLNSRAALLKELDKKSMKHHGVKASDYVAGYTPHHAIARDERKFKDEKEREQQVKNVVQLINNEAWWDKALPSDIRNAYNWSMDMSEATASQKYSIMKKMEKESLKRFGKKPWEVY